jgi:hypothetical protein
MATHVATKAAVVEEAEAASVDPLVDLRAGWEAQIDFSLSNPTLFRMLSDPDRVVNSPAARTGKAVLEARIHRVAVAGRLRVPERRAVELFQAAAIGAITTVLATPPDERDLGLVDAVLEGVLAQIITDNPVATDAGPVPMIIAFRAIAPSLPGLSETERQLLTEWLSRALAEDAQRSP